MGLVPMLVRAKMRRSELLKRLCDVEAHAHNLTHDLLFLLEEIRSARREDFKWLEKAHQKVMERGSDE